MFRHSVQTSPLSLFSSTSSSPFALFSTQVDLDLPQDAGLILVRDADDRRVDIAANDATQLQRDPTCFQLRTDGVAAVAPGSGSVPTSVSASSDGQTAGATLHTRGLLEDTVLHLQSPTVKKTWIRSPPLSPSTTGAHPDELGIRLPCIHFQFRPLGSKPLLFEVGIRDAGGRPARIRVSNFQARPSVYLEKAPASPPHRDVRSANTTAASPQRRHDDGKEPKGPILHLPLAGLPDDSESDDTRLTPWRSVTLSLPALVAQLNNPRLLSLSSARGLGQSASARGDCDVAERNEADASHPTALARRWERFERFHSISYIRIHANLRLRRVWCSDSPQHRQHGREAEGEAGVVGHGVDPEEFQVFAAALGSGQPGTGG